MAKWIMDFEGDLINLDRADYIQMRKIGNLFHVQCNSESFENTLEKFDCEIAAEDFMKRLFEKLEK